MRDIYYIYQMKTEAILNEFSKIACKGYTRSGDL